MTHNTARACKFMAHVDGHSKWYESFAIDRSDAIAQMKEIYTEESKIEVYIFQYKG